MPPSIALFGVGRWGENHLRSLCELRAEGLIENIHAIDEDDSRRQLVEAYGAIWCESVDGLPKEVEMAVVATPTPTHMTLSQMLLKRGLDVLVEKPMAADVNSAADLASTAVEHGRVLEVGLLLRHHPGVKELCRLIATGRLGRIDHIHCTRRSCRPAPPDSDIVETLSIHYLDLCCHILGQVEPNSVRCMAPFQVNKATLLLEFPPAVEGLCEVAWDAEKEVRTLLVRGSKGSALLDFAEHDRLQINQNKGWLTIPLSDNSSPLFSQLQNFITSSISHRRGQIKPDPISVGYALRSVRLVERARLAHRVALTRSSIEEAKTARL